MPRKETYSGPISAQAQQDLVSEGIENFELPKSVVMKIAKSSVRPTKILLTLMRIGLLLLLFFFLATRQCEVAKGNCAFTCERLDGVYQLLGWGFVPFCSFSWRMLMVFLLLLLQLQRTLYSSYSRRKPACC